jgi:ornithine carbamoyltransferase
MGIKESIADTARVLGPYVTMRLNSDVSNKQIVMNLQKYAGVPQFYNGFIRNYITPHKWLPTIWTMARKNSGMI